jgi:hypothetical protein
MSDDCSPARTAAFAPSPPRRRIALWRWIAALQFAYFVITGVWPLVHMPSFLAVTGPKTDLWLVRLVGALIAIIGAAVGLAAWRDRRKSDVAFLALASCAVLGLTDVVGVCTGVISRIYLLDAAAEAALILGWGVAIVRRPGVGSRSIA